MKGHGHRNLDLAYESAVLAHCVQHVWSWGRLRSPGNFQETLVFGRDPVVRGEKQVLASQWDRCLHQLAQVREDPQHCGRPGSVCLVPKCMGDAVGKRLCMAQLRLPAVQAVLIF